MVPPVTSMICLSFSDDSRRCSYPVIRRNEASLCRAQFQIWYWMSWLVWSAHVLPRRITQLHSIFVFNRAGPTAFQAERLEPVFFIADDFYAATVWAHGSILTLALMPSLRNSSSITACTYWL